MRRRLTKLRMNESKERAEDIRKARREKAKEEYIGAELADLFEKWQAEAREEDGRWNGPQRLRTRARKLKEPEFSWTMRKDKKWRNGTSPKKKAKNSCPRPQRKKKSKEMMKT